MAGLGTVVGLSAAAVALLLAAAWVVSLRLRDASIVDPLWGPAFVLVALVDTLSGGGDSGRRWLLLGLTGVWGIRLGAHLVARKLAEPGEDRRYTALRRRRGERFGRWSLWAVFGLQAALVLVVSLPLQVSAACREALSAAVAPGVAVFLVGLSFEALGDAQLRRFKAEAGSHSEVMDRGLWRYTRHPNYFGDACVWWGLWLIVLPAGGTWWSVIGPIVMTVLLVRVSGKAMLERDIATRRPGYEDYIRRTSGFFPRPPRR